MKLKLTSDCENFGSPSILRASITLLRFVLYKDWQSVRIRKENTFGAPYYWVKLEKVKP
jgi:hypothetical protein